MELEGRLPAALKGDINYCVIKQKGYLFIYEDINRKRFESYVGSIPDDECDFRHVFYGINADFRDALKERTKTKNGDPEKPELIDKGIEELIQRILGVNEEWNFVGFERKPSLS